MAGRLGRFALFFSVAVMVLVLAACGGRAPIEPVVVEKEVIKEVERPVVVEKEVIKEVPKEVVVEKEVIKEVEKPVVVEKEVVREVEVVKEAASSQATAAPAPASSGQPVKEVAVQKQVVVGQGQTQGFNPIGGSATVNAEPYDSTFFKHHGVNPFIDTEEDHLSTFAIDVDTASYTVARRFIQDGNLPDPDSVRVEEFVNFFDHGYPRPNDRAFAVHLEGSPSRFGSENHWLMRVGIQGKSIASHNRKDATLIFTIDVSGSMGREDRLGLVQRSLSLLVEELRPTDKVGIVVYGSRGSVLLEPTTGQDKANIMRAIYELRAGGSTFVEEGLRLAYDMAQDELDPNRITRVILLSDGVANVGETGTDAILRRIQKSVDKGITLTTVGFGMGNFNDVLMEQLANNGDGAYYYVDTLSEARRIFVDDLTGTLQVIAKDAKIQVDFNPEVVSRYRLLGYENRRVADEDFRDDTVDAGEIGANHSVTALYELKLHEEATGRVGTVHVRYQNPDADADTKEIVEVSKDIRRAQLASRFAEASPSFQLAAVVAEYAEILRESYWAQDGSLDDVVAEARRVRQLLPGELNVAEFTELAARTQLISAQGGSR